MPEYWEPELPITAETQSAQRTAGKGCICDTPSMKRKLPFDFRC